MHSKKVTMSMMEAFQTRFGDETYMPKPLGREWDLSGMPQLAKFLKVELPKLGGKATKSIKVWGSGIGTGLLRNMRELSTNMCPR